MAAQTVIWQAVDWTGLDYFTLTALTNGFLAEGRLIGVEENVPYTFQYKIRVDSQWHVRKVIIYTDLTNRLLFHLTADGQGLWYNQAGILLSELTGCMDVDLTLTPFTNTLPIRRLKFSPKQPQPIRVVYIDLPAGKISPVDQQYTHLTTNQYRFEQPAIAFSADLTVDADGLVTDYPNLFRRVYESQQTGY